MKWSQVLLFTQKEAPSDAEITSHQLMMRAGLLKKVAPGIFTYGFLALKALRKFENIIRKELDAIGGQEILMPMVQPKSLWEETNRWQEMGDLLLKFQNRNEQWFCLGGTHEEVVTDFIRNDLQSYKQFPQLVYQIQTKYRDEIRPRFGLMRGREFLMKDAYSFDLNKDSAIDSYHKLYQAYENIFSALGLEYRVVEADAGNIGGSLTHEFQLLADAGEDHLLVCSKCDYASNIEVSPVVLAKLEDYDGKTQESEIQEFATPSVQSIKDLAKHVAVEEKYLVKSLFYKDEEGKAYCFLLRGNDEFNEIKAKNALKLTNPPTMLTAEEVEKICGAKPGSCGPVGLKIPIYVDNALKNYTNFIVGANKDGYHLKNVNFKDFKQEDFIDIQMARAGDPCPKCEALLESKRGIEVGHCFYLGTKYSKAMKTSYLDQNGKTRDIEMGCYGIGVSRTLQAAIEQSHDKDGIIWPKAISPFDVHICLLDIKDEESNNVVKKLSEGLKGRNISVFIDDRKERPGVKFKDADLLGFPVRITVGAKALAKQEIEMKARKSSQNQRIAINNALDVIQNEFN